MVRVFVVCAHGGSILPTAFYLWDQCRAERHFHYVNYLASAHGTTSRRARPWVPWHECPYSIHRPWRRSAEPASLEVI
eukprot:6009304-Prymnesium_polylepis.1